MYWVVDESTRPARPRVEVADALAHRLDLRRRLLQQPGQAVDVVLGQPVEVVGDDAARRLALARVVDRVDLQLQAFRDAARADAAGVERLHPLQRDQHLLGVDAGPACPGWRRSPRAACAGSRRRRATRRSRRRGRGRAVDSGRTLIWVCRCWRRPTSAAIRSSALEVALHALGAHARRRLLPAVALVRRVADRRQQAVDVAGLQVDRDAVAGCGGRRVVVRRLLDFEEGIAAHRVVDFLGEVERGELQQAHGMLQAGRDGVLLFLGRSESGEVHGQGLGSIRRCRRAACRRRGVDGFDNATVVPSLRRASPRRALPREQRSAAREVGAQLAARGHRLRQLLPE